MERGAGAGYARFAPGNVVNSSAHGPEDLGLAERCLLWVQHGAARRAQRVQQQHPAVPDTRPCGDP